MGKNWMGLLLGVLLGAGAAGLAAGAWWLLRRPALTPDQWMKRIADSPAAADTLATMGDVGLEVLLRARESDDIRVHRRAARALASLGEKAVPALVKALPRAGARAEVILLAIGAKAVPALEEALAKDTSAPAAARAIGKLGPRGEAARSTLIGVVQDASRDEKARAEAAFALGLLGPDEAARVVLASAARAGPRLVRLDAIRALGLLGESARPSAPALVAVLDDPDEDLAWAAAAVLGRWRIAPAAPKLARLAAARWDDEPVNALALMGDASRTGVRALLVSGPWSLAQDQACRQLGQPLVADLAALVGDKDVGPQALRWLTALGPMAREAAPSLKTPAAAEAALAVTPDGTPEAVKSLLARIAPDPIADRHTLSAALLALHPDPLAALTPLAAISSWLDHDAPRIAYALRTAAPTRDTIAELADGTRRPDIGEACLAALHSLGPAAKDALPQVRAALGGRWPVHAAIALLSIDPAGEKERALPVLLAACKTPEGRAALPPILDTLENPPSELLDVIRDDLGRFLTLLGNYPREERLGLAPDLVRVVTAAPGPARGRLAARLRELGPAALPFLRPLIKGEQLPKIAGLLADPALNLPDADLDTVARRTADADENIRLAAASVLSSLGARTDASAGIALGLLGHHLPELRAAGARALRVERDRSSLHECLFDPSAAVRAAAAHALAGDDAMRPLLRDGDPAVRLEAALGLLKTSARDEAAAELLALAPHASPAARLQIAEALPDQAAALTPLLEADTRGAGVGDALRAAAWLVRHAPAKSARALDRLIAGLDESDEAARLLATLGAKARPAEPWLKRHLRLRQTRPTREALEAALRAITGGGA